jgi:cytoskeletal protein CcmA (bactofilin family)
MALKSFGRGGNGTDLPGSTPLPSTAPSKGSSPGGLTAFIDQGSEFEGKLQFRDTVRIDGRFRGEISSENTLIVGESGEIEATIRSKTISISGSVDGDVTAEQKVVLHKTARVNGNVSAPALQIEEGAVLNGQVNMVSGDSGSNKLKSVPAGVGQPKAEEKS